MKKFVSMVLVLSLMCLLPSAAFAASDSEIAMDDELPIIQTVRVGQDIYATNVELLDNGCVCITNVVSDEVIPFGNTDQEREKTFKHKFYGANDQLLATAEVTVKGIFSVTDRVAEIYDVEVNFKGAEQSSFSVDNIYYYGDTATVVINYINVHFATFNYKISTNGNITTV
jgi:hypothetical protein